MIVKLLTMSVTANNSKNYYLAKTITVVTEDVQNLNTIIRQHTLSPQEVSPEAYELNFNVDLATQTFTEDVTIVFSLKCVKSVIILKKGNFNVCNVRLRKENTSLPLHMITDYKVKDSLIIQSNRLSADKYSLQVQVNGELSSQPNGLFIIKSEENDSPDSYIILTQISRNNAKDIFPVFEGLSFTSTFKTTLIYPSKEQVSVISNTKPEKFIANFPHEYSTTVCFEESPLLRNDKIFWAMSNYISSDTIATKSGISFTLYFRKDIMEHISEVPTLMVTLLDNLAKYVNVKLTLLSLSIILVPGFWDSMSCAGIPGVVVLDEYLVTAMKKKSCSEFVRSIIYLAHELTHLWLGGEVMISNKEEEWLIEGLTSIVAHECGLMTYPQWYTDWVPLKNEIIPILGTECPVSAYFSTHADAAENTLGTSESDEFFITRYRSVALMRMVWAISPGNFRVCVSSLFTKSEKANFTQMWKEMTDESKMGVNELLHFWNYKNSGYPVIYIKTTHKNIHIMSQRPFVRTFNENKLPSSRTASWPILIKYIDLTKKEAVKDVWINHDANEVPLEHLHGKLFKLNWHSSGYYRVNYTFEQWLGFGEILNLHPNMLDPEDRANLIDDAFNLAAAGHLQYHIALTLVSYLRHGTEQHYYPLATGFRLLRRIYYYCLGTDTEILFEKFMQEIMVKSLKKSVWLLDRATVMDTLVRTEIILTGCWSNNSDVLDKIHDFYVSWFNQTPELVHIDMLDIITKYGLAGTPDKKLWNETLSAYNATKEKSIHLWAALSGIKDTGLLNVLINSAVSKDDSLKRTFDKLYVIAENPLAAIPLWNSIKKLVPDLDDGEMKTYSKLISCIKRIVYFIKDENTLKEIFHYVSRVESTCEIREIRNIIAESSIWPMKNHGVIKEWLTRALVSLYK